MIGGGEDQILRIESPDLYRLFQQTRDVDKKVYAALRKALKKSADPILADMRSAVMGIPARKHHSGVRAAIASGLSVGIAASSENTAGIRIKASAKGLPASKKLLVKTMNKESFRHPVFADSRSIRKQWWWSQQQGNPYFGRIVVRHWDDVQAEVVKVFDEVTDSLSKGS